MGWPDMLKDALKTIAVVSEGVGRLERACERIDRRVDELIAGVAITNQRVTKVETSLDNLGPVAQQAATAAAHSVVDGVIRDVDRRLQHLEWSVYPDKAPPRLNRGSATQALPPGE